MLQDTESSPNGSAGIVSGRVALCGDPRVGKSTLMNRARQRLVLGPKAADIQTKEPTNVSYGEKSKNIERLSYTAVPPSRLQSLHDGDAGGNELIVVEISDLGDTLSGEAHSLVHSPSDHAHYQLDELFGEKNILVVMFDLTRRQTFDSCDQWIDLWKRHAGQNTGHSAGVLVGAKSRTGYRAVYEHEALRFAAKRNMSYLELDAKESDDDVDLFVLYLARIALRLYRYSLHLQLAGRRGCPPDCTETERVHRHVFRKGTSENHIEYVTQEELVRVALQQPKPSLQPSWVRVANLWRDTEPPPYARHEPQRLPVMQIHCPEDPFANRLLPAQPPDEDGPLRVPTNVYTRPNQPPFTERTSLLTALWGGGGVERTVTERILGWLLYSCTWKRL